MLIVETFSQIDSFPCIINTRRTLYNSLWELILRQTLTLTFDIDTNEIKQDMLGRTRQNSHDYQVPFNNNRNRKRKSFYIFGLSCHNSMYALIYRQPKLLISITEVPQLIFYYGISRFSLHFICLALGMSYGNSKLIYYII